MSIQRRFLGATLGALLFVAPAVASDAKSEVDAVRAKLLADKKALVTTNLVLTDAEANEFWPLYDEYEADMKGVQQRLANVVTQYAASQEKLTDEEAANLTAAYLLAEEDRATYRRAYLADFAKVLTGKKLARFYQLENKFDAAVRYEMAVAIPLVSQ